MSGDKALHAWVEEVKKTMTELREEWSNFYATDPEMAAILQSAIRPLYYFRQEYTERNEDKKFHDNRTAGAESGAVVVESKKNEPAAAVAKSAAPKVEKVRLVLSGDTKPHREWIKDLGFRWDKDKYHWWGYVEPAVATAIKKDIADRKYKIDVQEG